MPTSLPIISTSSQNDRTTSEFLQERFIPFAETLRTELGAKTIEHRSTLGGTKTGRPQQPIGDLDVVSFAGRDQVAYTDEFRADVVIGIRGKPQNDNRLSCPHGFENQM